MAVWVERIVALAAIPLLCACTTGGQVDENQSQEESKDEKFVATVSRATLWEGTLTRSELIDRGRGVCDMYDEQGVASTVSNIRELGASDDTVHKVLGAAMIVGTSVYCPEYWPDLKAALDAS